ncbi:MAG: carbamoyltransferase HypF [Gemmatimonadaceae bacterium]
MSVVTCEQKHLRAGSGRVIERRVIAVEGTVQGVGFRPYVHSLATARDLRGFVRNDSGGLTIDVQGDGAAIDDFVSHLTSNPPPLAIISRVHASIAEVQPRNGFWIVASDRNESAQPGRIKRRTQISPDFATCDDCLRELLDPADRRYGYPFINCTNCGPRFTIVHDLPYDRPHTTMASFRMCERCRSEYEDPADRRFHAQPIACSDCGPVLRLIAADLPVADDALNGDPVAGAAWIIIDAAIVAVKGLGGYHLACDATSVTAVERLRRRKHREEKPFAVMVATPDDARAICLVEHAEVALLTSPERPIVLLRRRDDITPALAEAIEAIAPRNRFVGVMLPYTPLHHLLLAKAGRPLVMTSGNLRDEPIAFDDDDARARLTTIADAFLTHDRPIATRCDDSVMRVIAEAPVLIRRSRGFAPRPIDVRIPFPAHVLAVGAHLKNTFCLARGNSAFLSHHIGDLENSSAVRSLEDGVAHYRDLVGVDPAIVAHDLHPGYLSSQLAARLDIPVRVAVQHHHAHIASCMAEHGLTGPVIGVALDGTGLGDDGAIWGGEFLLVDSSGSQRVGHLGYVPLPGGDAAVRHPIRMAVAHLRAAYGSEAQSLPLSLFDRIGAEKLSMLDQMMAKKVNSPPTSSVGRLFDAVASLLGVRDVARFEGQAAMELEAAADANTRRSYTFALGGPDDQIVADASPVIRAIVDDIVRSAGTAEIAGAFHNALSDMILAVARRVRLATGVHRVALSGGVFQNALLTSRSVCALTDDGFAVYTQRQVPCNDGGLSLGQAYVVALAAIEKKASDFQVTRARTEEACA